jgi:peptidoglycan-N-acetylglucosamine deacetylase
MRHLLFAFCFAGLVVCAQTREVAITIDDLPRGGDGGGRDVESVRRMTVKLLDEMRGVPVIGFVNAGRAGEMGDAGLQSILRVWLDHGAELGNHSYSHPNLDNVTLAEYEADIVRGEPALVKALGHRPRYFRHPFLHTGPDAAKKDGLAAFLKERGYVVAPVTLDDSDWMFAAVYGDALKRGDAALAARVRAAYVPYMESIFAFFEARSVEVAQTLLIHASQLNADAMPDLLAMMRRRGYGFVSLATALKDPAYGLADGYVGRMGFSWLHRWAVAKGMAAKYEPDEPGWIGAEYKKVGKK